MRAVTLILAAVTVMPMSAVETPLTWAARLRLKAVSSNESMVASMMAVKMHVYAWVPCGAGGNGDSDWCGEGGVDGDGTGGGEDGDCDGDV